MNLQVAASKKGDEFHPKFSTLRFLDSEIILDNNPISFPLSVTILLKHPLLLFPPLPTTRKQSDQK
jgi:hypothetical protein